jgi:hypothetical protein
MIILCNLRRSNPKALYYGGTLNTESSNWISDWTSFTIKRALISLMKESEVLDYFDRTFKQDYKIRMALLGRLGELCKIDNSNVEFVRQLVLELIELERRIPSNRRSAIDSALSQLVPLLTPKEQVNFATKFIQYSRTKRRRLGLQIIAEHFLPEHKQLLLDCFERFHDDRALITLTRANANITDIVDKLLSNLPKPNQQAGVFERLIIQDFSYASELALQYPVAFVWGAGRTRCIKTIPIITKILQDDKINSEYIGLIVWALEKLEAREELQKLALKYSLELPKICEIT